MSTKQGRLRYGLNTQKYQRMVQNAGKWEDYLKQTGGSSYSTTQSTTQDQTLPSNYGTQQYQGPISALTGAGQVSPQVTQERLDAQGLDYFSSLPEFTDVSNNPTYYYGEIKKTPAMLRAEQRILGYQPSVWQTPQAVARYYHQLQSGLPQPEWLEGQRAQIEGAYKYFEYKNNNKPWTEWGYLLPDDPAHAFLQTLPTPPSGALGNAQAEKYANVEAVKSGDISWSQLAPDVRAKILGDPEFYKGEITNYPMWVHQEILADPNFNWDEVGALQKAYYGISSQPWAMGAIQGGLLGIGGGPVGGIAGVATGGVLGAVAQATGYDPTKTVREQTNLASKAFGALNWFVEQAEQTLGLGFQTIGELAKPGGERDLSQVFTKEGYQAGLGTFELLGPTLMDVPRMYSEAWTKHKDEGIELNDAIAQVINSRMEGPLEAYLGSNVLVQTGKGHMLKALEDARHRIENGENYRQVMVEAQEGIYAQLFDMGMQAIADPLNFISPVGAEVTGRVADATGHPTLGRSMRGAEGVGKGLKAYGADVQTGNVAPGFRYDQLGAVSQFIAGISVDENGNPTLRSGPFTKNGLLSKPQEGWFNYISTLTPESRAQVGLGLANDNILAMLNMFDNPDDFVSFWDNVKNGDMEQAKAMGARFMDAPEFYTILPAMKEFELDSLTALWEMSRPNADLVYRVAQVLGDTPYNILDDLATENGAEQVFQRLRNLEGTDAPNQAILDDIANNRLGVEDLKSASEIFNGDATAPLDAGQWKAMVADKMTTHFSDWAVDFFGLQPDSMFFRLAGTMKKAQSLLLLGLNPAYAINNGVNNMVTRMATGNFGFMTSKQIDNFIGRLGIDPYRLSEGVGAGGDVTGARTAMGPGEILSGAKRTTGLLDTVNRTIKGVGDKIGFAQALSAKIEQVESTNAFVIGMKKAWGRMWKRGRGFSRMDAQLESAINNVYPGGADIIYRGIEAGMNKAEIEKIIMSGEKRIRARALVEASANEIGVDPELATEMLDQMGLLDQLDELTEGATDQSQIDNAFKHVVNKAQDWIDARIADGLEERTQATRDRIVSDGWGSVVDIYVDAEMKIMERWLEHYQAFEDVFSRIGDIDDLGIRRQLLDDVYRQQSREWARVNLMELSAYRGMAEGLGIALTDDSRTFLARKAEIHSLWDDAYTFRLEENAKYADKYSGDWDNPRRYADRDALQRRIDRKFQETFRAVKNRQSEMGDVFARQFSPFGDDAVSMAKRYWQEVMTFRDEMWKANQTHRRSLRDMTYDQRQQANAKFWHETYPALIREFEALKINGALELDRTVRRGRGGTTTPQGPEPVPGGPGPAPEPAPAPRSGATQEAIDYVRSATDPTGSIPAFITRNLERIARENGIEIRPDMAPDDVVQAFLEKYPELKKQPKETAPETAKVEKTPEQIQAEQERQGVFGIARDFGIASMDENGTPLYGANHHILAIVRKYGGPEGKKIAKFAELGDKLDLVRQAFEERKKIKDAQGRMFGREVKTEAVQRNKPRYTGPKIHRNTTIIGAIKELGGLSLEMRGDLTGEQKFNRIPGLFKKKGYNIDTIARSLAESGYPIDINHPNDPGGINQTTELIRRALAGEKIYNIEHDINSDASKAHAEHISQVLEERQAKILPDNMKRINEIIKQVEALDPDDPYNGASVDFDALTDLMTVPEDIANTVVDPKTGKTYIQYVSDLWDYADQKAKAVAETKAIAEKIARADKDISDALKQRNDFYTKEKFRSDLVEKFGLSQKEADNTVALVDARAKVWGAMTGKDPATWYRERIAGIVGHEPGTIRDVRDFGGGGHIPHENLPQAFYKWFGDSVVKDEKGNPIVVYRGEHGRLIGDEQLQTTRGSYSFADAESASLYAKDPNDYNLYPRAEQPRVIPAYLKMENPIINTDDPFMDLNILVDALGPDEARRIAIKYDEQIRYTNNWEENYRAYQSVADLLNADPDALGDLYFDAYHYLDDADEVAILKKAGYDGAIHGGNGATAGLPEYKVFDKSQIKSLWNRGTFDPNNPDLLMQRVFHGTPWKFDQFSLDAIGKGEGAQAYGWGLYFTEDLGIAQHYRKKLSKRGFVKYQGEMVNIGKSVEDSTPMELALSLLQETNGHEGTALNNIDDYIRLTGEGGGPVHDAMLKAKDWVIREYNPDKFVGSDTPQRISVNGKMIWGETDLMANDAKLYKGFLEFDVRQRSINAEKVPDMVPRIRDEMERSLAGLKRAIETDQHIISLGDTYRRLEDVEAGLAFLDHYGDENIQVLPKETFGQVYEVEIPDDFDKNYLLWDEPLYRQPEAVQEVIRQYIDQEYGEPAWVQDYQYTDYIAGKDRTGYSTYHEGIHYTIVQLDQLDADTFWKYFPNQDLPEVLDGVWMLEADNGRPYGRKSKVRAMFESKAEAFTHFKENIATSSMGGEDFYQMIFDRQSQAQSLLAREQIANEYGSVIQAQERRDYLDAKIRREKRANPGYDGPEVAESNHIYGLLEKAEYKPGSDFRMGDAKLASMALREKGLDGIKYIDGNTRYLDENKSYNYVVFDDQAVQIMDTFYQGLEASRQLEDPKGAVSFMNDGRAIIHAFEQADVSTVVHELGHIFRRDLPIEDLRIVEKWAGVEDGNWHVGAEEKFARAFEKYLANGTAPTDALHTVFAQFRAWIREIYAVISGSAIDVNVTAEVKGVFDRLFVEQKQVTFEIDMKKAKQESKSTLTTDLLAKAKEARAMKEKARAKDRPVTPPDFSEQLGGDVLGDAKKTDEQVGRFSYEVDKAKVEKIANEFKSGVDLEAIKAKAKEIRELKNKQKEPLAKDKTGQVHMWGAGEDTPLFTGTLKKAKQETFDPKVPDAKQESLFNMRPEMKGAKKVDDLGKKGPLLQRNSNPVFYSKLENFLDGISQHTMTAEQLDGMLKKGGIKNDELYWTGLDELIADRAGQKITKQEALDHVRRNRIEVFDEFHTDIWLNFEIRKQEMRDVLRDANKGLSNAQAWSEISMLHTDFVDQTARHGSWEYDRMVPPEHQGKGLTPLESIDRQDLYDLYELFSSTREGEEGIPSRYESYTVPGGRNYKELLLRWDNQSPDTDTYYFSDHFDEPNILAHVRMTDRINSDGQRVLYIEEIQSDWAMDARKKGVETKAGRLELDRLNREQDNLIMELQDKHGEVGWRLAIEDADDIATMNRIDELGTEIRNLEDDGLVPEGPLLKTDQYTQLALKRIMRHAIDEGYDAVSWTPGDLQVDRYDLSKQVKRIDYEPSSNWLEVIGHDDGLITSGTYPPEKLPSVLGEYVTEVLLEKPEIEDGVHKYKRIDHPEDMKVGGQGMIKYYDEILPKNLKKLTKRFGTFPSDNYIGTNESLNAVDSSLHKRKGNIDPDDLQAMIEDGDLIWSPMIEINDAMRKGAGAPMPLFQLADSAGAPKGFELEASRLYAEMGTDSPYFKEWFGDSKILDENGKPLRVYHGTLSEFDEFDTRISNADSAVGQGIYMTDSTLDASANYASLEGGDPTYRIEQQEQIVADDIYDIINVDDYSDDFYKSVGTTRERVELAQGWEDPSVDIWNDEFDGLRRALAMEYAGITNEGQVMPLYVRMERPFDIENTNFYREYGMPDEVLIDQIISLVEDEDGVTISRDEATLKILEDGRGHWLEKLGEQDQYTYVDQDGQAVDVLGAVRSLIEDEYEWIIGDPEYRLAPILEDLDYYDKLTARNIVDVLQKHLADLEGFDGEFLSGTAVRDISKLLGYDGIIMDANRSFNLDNMPEGTRHFIVFDPTQVKSVWNQGSFERSTPKLLLQRGQPKDTRMVAMHNLNPSDLIGADYLGGMPVPSLAVLKEGADFTSFGEITLIGTKEMVDPAIGGNKTYSRDVYSPTKPRQEWKKVKMAKADALYDVLGPYFKKYNDPGHMIWDPMVNSPDKADLLMAMEHSPAVKAWFLDEAGIGAPDPVEVPTVIRSNKGRILDDSPTWKAWAEKVDLNRWSDQPFYPDSPFRVEITDILMKAMEESFPKEKYNVEVKTVLDSGWRETLFDRTDGLVNYSTYEVLREYAQEVQHPTTEIHIAETRELLDSQIADNGLAGEFQSFIREKANVFDYPRMKLKGRMVPYTLDNIVEHMTGRVVGREDTLSFGDGKVASYGAKKFSSMDELKAWGDTIVSSEEFKIAKDYAGEKANTYRTVLLDELEGKAYDTWNMLDDANRALAYYLKEGPKKRSVSAMRENINRAMSVATSHISDKVVNLALDAVEAIRETPTEYFESKPQRAVGLNEWAGAIVPDNVDPKVIEILEKNGVQYAKYEAGNTEARIQATQAFQASEPDVLFQKAYHGSPHRFDKFTLDKIGTGEGAQAYGWGLYFADSKNVAEWYRKNLEMRTVNYRGEPIRTALGKFELRDHYQRTLYNAVQEVTKKISRYRYDPRLAVQTVLDDFKTNLRRYEIEFEGDGYWRIESDRRTHLGRPELPQLIVDHIDQVKAYKDPMYEDNWILAYKDPDDGHFIMAPKNFDSKARAQNYLDGWHNANKGEIYKVQAPDTNVPHYYFTEWEATTWGKAHYEKGLELIRERLARLESDLDPDHFSLDKGQLYQVEIPDDGYLLWDESLFAQPNAVKRALEIMGARKERIQPQWRERILPDGNVMYSLGDGQGGDGAIRSYLIETENSIDVYKRNKYSGAYKKTPENLQTAMTDLEVQHGDLWGTYWVFPDELHIEPQSVIDVTGQDLYHLLSRSMSNSRREASMKLKEAGLMGIKYADGNTRYSQGPKNYNYVIFDDDAVKILDTFYQQEPTDMGPEFKPLDPGQPGDNPPGTYDQAGGSLYDGEVMDEGWSHMVKPLLEGMQNEAHRQLNEPAIEGVNFDDQTQRDLGRYMRQVQGDMASTKMGAIRYGETMRDYALLNYNRRYGFDKMIDTVFPYQFWYTRSMLNWGLRALDNPAWFANYARLRMMQNRYKNDLPERMRDKFRIPAPWLPEWTGQNLYIDPMKMIFPFANMLGPFKQIQRDQQYQLVEAERILQEWSKDNTVSQTEISKALSTRQGPTWDKALAEAKVRREADIKNPFDFISVMMGPAWYLSTPAKLMGYDGGKETIGELPLTKTARAVETITKDTPMEPVGQIFGALGKPEEWARKSLGLPEFGEFGEYYTKRQVSNLVAEGLYTPEQGVQAMIEKKGEIWDLARERVKEELALRVPLAGSLGAGLEGDLEGMIKSLPFSLLGSGLLPEGELRYRGLKEKWDHAWELYDQGDTDAVNKFFDDYPEYEAYLAKGKDDETLIRSFLTGQIWENWMALDKANKKVVTSQMGELFERSFLDKETRNYDILDTETLTIWARMLKGQVPQTERTEAITSIPEAQIPQLEGIPVAISAGLNQYDTWRETNYPNIYPIQEMYYSVPEKDRRRILNMFPILAKYWEERREYLTQHPEVAQFIDRNFSEAILSGEAEPIGMDREQAKRLLMYYRPSDFDEPVRTADYYLDQVSDFTKIQVITYATTGRAIGGGALQELQKVWENDGKPGETFKKWIDLIIVPTLVIGE